MGKEREVGDESGKVAGARDHADLADYIRHMRDSMLP